MNIIISVIIFVVLFVLLGLYLTEYLFGRKKQIKKINLGEIYKPLDKYYINFKSLIVLYIISFLYIVGGMFVDNNTALKLGLLYSGTVLSIYTTYSYWDNIGTVYKLLLLGSILSYTVYNTYGQKTPTIRDEIYNNVLSWLKSFI